MSSLRQVVLRSRLLSSLLFSSCRLSSSKSVGEDHHKPTAERYPLLKLKRKSTYSQVTSRDLDKFRQILNNDPGQVVIDEDQLVDYNVDWTGSCLGQCKLALLPRNTQELAAILKHCNERKLAVAPRGGNTGLVGASVPVFDEIAVSLRLMNKFISLDPITGIATSEAGIILDTLDKAVGEFGFTVPLDLGARHSCQIGGNIATNAGGIRLIRYGSLRANVLGLEFVTADGTVLDCLSTMRKDNTGYDLKSLMIGSEGTLGIITKVALLCPPKPQSVNVALIGVKTFDQILEIFKLSRRFLVEILSGFEFFDSQCYEAVEKNLGHKCPLTRRPYFVLIETSGSKMEHDYEKLELLTSETLKAGLCSENDVVLASDMTKQKELWQFREDIAVAHQKEGYVYKFDVSLPQKDFPALHDAVTERLSHLKKERIRIASYGHVGDGNLHLNVTSPSYDHEIMGALDPFVFEFVSLKGGSISAEHGIGLRKRHLYRYSKKPEVVEAMRALKRHFDPNGILNPYKTVDPDLDP